MGTPKISTFIIALIWVGFFAAIFGSFISNMGTNYNVGNNGDDIKILNKMNEVNSLTEEIKTSSMTFSENTNAIDIIGGYFSNGYKTLIVAVKSLNTFDSIVEYTFNNSNLNIPALKYLNSAIIGTVLILIIIGVLLSAILKKDV